MTLAHPPVIPRSRAGALALAACLVLAIASLDARTGSDTNIVIVYLVPVGFASWILGRRWGLAVAALAAGLSLAADVYASGPAGGSWIAAWNAVVEFVVLSGAAVTLSALRASLTREQAASRRDYLTGLSNWRALAEAADVELARLRRFARPLTIVYMDCDRFKRVNDTYGHATGDELLRMIAEAIVSTVRAVDTVARLGGDEFVVLLPETDAQAAEAAIERMQKGIEGAMASRDWPVTMSFGAATFVDPPDSVDELLSAADRLLYESKQSGRDRATFATYGERTA